MLAWGSRTGSAGWGAHKAKTGLPGRESTLSQASSEEGAAGLAGTTAGSQARLEGCFGAMAGWVSNSPGNAPVETTGGPGKASGTALWAAWFWACIWLVLGAWA
jgi:hypothetical protein